MKLRVYANNIQLLDLMYVPTPAFVELLCDHYPTLELPALSYPSPYPHLPAYSKQDTRTKGRK
jgi:hypothetical protein